jgi:chorismate lyase / 3-hydroxybenzoate synthase
MRALIPVWPEFVRTDDVEREHALAVVGFGDALAGACVTISARQLGSFPLAEVWRTSLPIEKSRIGDVSFAANGAVLIGTISAADSETDLATARVYEQIVDAVRTAGYPNLLRVWNHVGSINEYEGDLERYKRFAKGRHEALTRCGYERQHFPAASAVGTTRKGLAVYFVASRAAGVQVENPRQVAAYDYPPVHGPRSPSFARATVAQWNGSAMIFVSGTSSVVGHETRHHGNVKAQLEETLENMRMIVAEAAARIGRKASLDHLTIAKTYLRNAADYERIAPLVTSQLRSTQHLFLESDICRRDLLLEIEGVARI